VTPTASGLLLDTGDRVLLLLRALGNFPGTWGFPGGMIDDGEAPYEAACRECGEEIGFLPPHKVERVVTLGRFTSFLCRVPSEVASQPVQLTREHSAAQWAPDAWVEQNQDLVHPGAVPVLGFLELVRDARK